MRLRSRGSAALVLSGLALLAGLFAPLIIELRPRPDWTIAWWALGVVLTSLGVRASRLLYAAGALALWALLCLCLFTQVSVFSLPPGSVWGQRGILLTSIFLIWLWLHQPPSWLWRGFVATELATLFVLLTLILIAPPIGRTVSFTWLAVDSHGRVYATESDLGIIWAFDANGSRSNLWPRRAVPGKAGPGLQPPGFGAELLQVPGTNTPRRNGPTDANLVFCGLAVDGLDRVYMVDPDLRQLRQFTPDGELRGVWPLPATYTPARGCLVADATRVYVGDGQGFIHVFGQEGEVQAHWIVEQAPLGLALSREGVLVLRAQTLDVVQIPDGKVLRTFTIPALQQGIGAPYRSVLMRANGELLLSDANAGLLRRFAPDGTERQPVGMAALWPGQFAGPGGMPGELAEPVGLAEDGQQRLYVADTAFRVIQRFDTSGKVDGVIAVPEQEATDMRPALP